MKYSENNKLIGIIATLILITTVTFCLSANSPVTALAEDISGKKLQYFELKQPIAVYKDGEKVYIAEKNKIILYFNDTYRTVELDKAYQSASGKAKTFNVTHIEKCGDLLLFLSDGELFSVNAETLSLTTTPILTEVSAFSTLNNEFIATKIDKNAACLKFFRTAEDNLTITEFTPENVNCTTLGVPQTIAYAQNDNSTNTSYFYPYNGVYKVNNKDLSSICDDTPCFMTIDSDTLYMRVTDNANDVIYSFNASSKEKNLLIDLNSNVKNAGGFHVSGNKMLICDTDRNRVIEYDLSSGTPTLTDFEITFTKINLPDEFGFSLDKSPKCVTVAENAELYNIKLNESIDKKYFVYNGMFKTTKQSEFLVLSEIKNGSEEYYLIHGECTALVMKTDYTAQPLTRNTPEKSELIFANDSSIYKLPFIKAGKTTDKNNRLFVLTSAKRGENVTLLNEFSINGVKIAYVKYKNHEGYIPLSCLTEKANPTPTRKNYLTATTSKKTTVVFTDKELKTKTDELPSYSEVFICSDEDGSLYITYGDGKYGYISKTDVEKKGEYTKRVIMVVILLAFSLCVATIFFEKKYLYSNENKSK